MPGPVPGAPIAAVEPSADIATDQPKFPFAEASLAITLAPTADQLVPLRL